MKTMTTRHLLILGLAGTLALAWLAPNDDNGAAASADRAKHGRKAVSGAAGKAPRQNAAATLAMADGQRLQSEPRTAPPEDAPDLFKGFSWYVPPPPPPPPPPAPPPKPTAPPLPFALMGQYAEGGSKLLILSRGDRVITAAVGDVIDKTYKIESLNAGVLTFVYLPLSENQTLNTGGIQ